MKESRNVRGAAPAGLSSAFETVSTASSSSTGGAEHSRSSNLDEARQKCRIARLRNRLHKEIILAIKATDGEPRFNTYRDVIRTQSASGGVSSIARAKSGNRPARATTLRSHRALRALRMERIHSEGRTAASSHQIVTGKDALMRS